VKRKGNRKTIWQKETLPVIERDTSRQAHKHTDRQKHMHTHRETETDAHAHTHTHTHTHRASPQTCGA
jgi:hypothetical protein